MTEQLSDFTILLSVLGASNDISAILGRMRHVSVTVFGDFCLDAYWELDDNATELSIETGLPVRRVKMQRYTLGGAGGVLANLTQMGVGCVRAVGLVGDDVFGEKMLALLAASGADASSFLVDPEWQTMVYAKPCFGAREDSRIDFGAFNSIRTELLDKLMRGLESAAVESRVVILNQQVPLGLSTPAVIERLNEVIALHPSTMFLVDSRHYPEKYKGATLKLNVGEAARLLYVDRSHAASDECARDFALRIYGKTGKPVFLTRGESGIAVVVDGEVTLVPGLQVIEQTDPVGAGDAVVAALAAALAADASPVEAAVMGNIAGMITVKKLKTAGTASAGEILAAANELDYIFRPELADSPRQARYLPDTEIEVIGDLPANLAIKHCIFDHDGTLSTLREGWEQIMEPMMMHAILGDQHDTVDEDVFQRVRETVTQFIDRTTGIQTLVQMKGLTELVRQSGFVPVGEILDEHGYKHIYNVELLKRVKSRIEKLKRGDLEPGDFQIKNAGALLQELHRRNVKLYLASGTDQGDVIAEAEAMSYAHLFEGRIFGAVGDIRVEAKKVVIEKIIREHNLAGHEFATFGDGPVELRETQRRGGVCIGVASDELRRFGLNLSKRRRLIRAGANFVISDFTQLSALLRVLQLDGQRSRERCE